MHARIYIHIHICKSGHVARLNTLPEKCSFSYKPVPWNVDTHIPLSSKMLLILVFVFVPVGRVYSRCDHGLDVLYTVIDNYYLPSYSIGFSSFLPFPLGLWELCRGVLIVVSILMNILGIIEE